MKVIHSAQIKGMRNSKNIAKEHTHRDRRYNGEDFISSSHSKKKEDQLQYVI
jgi:hypothetical protein